MAYVSVPKDLSKVKSKVLFNLTKRQLLCFSLAALAGVPVYFLLKPFLGTTVAAIVMLMVMLPFVFFALYEKDGIPAEKYLGYVIKAIFIKDRVRPYRTENIYSYNKEKINKEKMNGGDFNGKNINDQRRRQLDAQQKGVRKGRQANS